MNNQTVLITGALGDIGRSLAAEFGQVGARLALCDIAPAAAARTLLDGLHRTGVVAAYGQVDVTDAAAVNGFVDTIAQEGGMDICIANAGIVERGALSDLALDAWRRTLDVNLTGGFLTAQAAVRAMRTAGRGGHIVFIGSWTQHIPRAGIGAYCASKAGLEMLAKCLALELGPEGIRANVVAPGWVDAGLTRKNLAVHPELREVMESQIPLGRMISADDFARTVRMLCSDGAAYVTGTTLVVDGGASLVFRK